MKENECGECASKTMLDEEVDSTQYRGLDE